MKRLLIICGLTATGKTALGVDFARKYNGEIISADSRQVYKRMDIISGKDIPVESKFQDKSAKFEKRDDRIWVGYREKEGIPVWLVDIVEPDFPFNLSDYSTISYQVVREIWKRGKLPIVVGGSGLYIKTFVDPMPAMCIPPNHKLRTETENNDVGILARKLKDTDPKRWEKMNNSDRNNPRRLVRALEVSLWQQKHWVIPVTNCLVETDSLLWIGLKTDFKKLYPRIEERVDKRVAHGAVDEIQSLLRAGFGWNLNSMNSLGIREFKEYINGKETLMEAVNRWKMRERDFSRRQKTWFKREKRIIWFDISGKNFRMEIEESVDKWYNQN